MKQFKLFTLFMALACATNVWAQWSGDGSSSDPYKIASASDWNTLATNVNAGNNYSGKNFKLTANITVNEMVGTDSNRFSGTFDGDGHTLTFNIGTSGSHFSEAKCGPFRYINGATFKRLHVAGTIYTSNQNAGMVGHAKGNNYFLSCHCSLTINSSRDGDGTHGGFIGNNNNGAKSYFTNCLFDGAFVSTITTNCGGFIGWTEGNQSSKAYFTNCLFAPSGILSTGGHKTFSRSRNTSDVSVTNSYYKQTMGDAQGTDASSMSNADLLAALGGMWEISGNAVIPIIHPFSLTIAGSGTVNDPYLITSTSDWNAFASYVNSGIDFNESYFKLTADITVSEMVGTDSRRFSGTFNGDGHTLTFNKGTSGSPVSEGYCAPFRYINSATIKRLHVAGTIYTSNQFAGMVGHAKGTNYFQSCHSSLTINSSKDGDGTHGGFIANNNQTSYFTNCLFDGSFISTLTHSWGGFAGWTGSGYAYFTNCLFAPASISISNTNSCKTFARYNNSNASYSNAYYKQTLGDAQGTDASSMTNEQLLAALGGAWQISGGKVVPIIQVQTLTGSGTAGSPYLIASTADWDKLSFNVTECNEPYNGKYFKLTADIAVTSTIGTDACAFGGIFDGDGHVLHLNIKDVSANGTAPFRYIQDATIQYVKTDGFLTGKMHCAGLVGFANGTNNLIQGCEVAAEVYGGDGCTHNGGILGHGKNSTTTIQDCLFSGALEGATNTAGIIYGWGDGEGHHTIINCLFSGECGGSPTTVLIPNRGTKTIRNCYHTTAGPTDGTDASSMSRADLLSALGAEWGMRETHVVPVRFAASVTPQAGAAEVDLESDYVPTQIKNGTFGVRPWMSYRYSGADYTSYYAASSVSNDQIIEASYPNGVNSGWNTTENKTLDRGLFEYMHYVYNDNIPCYGGCVEMNSQNCAVLWQDLSTHSHDVIRWSLLHAARTGYGPDVQSMRVEVGSPEYSGTNIVAATGINDAVNSKITTATKATYNSDGYSGTYAKGGDNLAKLALNKNTAPDNNAWHQVRGIYLIPEGQTVTRFAFISTSIDADANKMSAGNYLDNLAFSTLIGNLSAVQLDNGDVVLRGYWGETDASKRLVVTTDSKTGSNTYYGMSSVANENFKITIPEATMGGATSLSVYHEDYPEAGRSITITPSYKLSISAPSTDENGWYLISSPIGTVNPSSVINMTDNSYDIFRFNQNPAQNAAGDYLEWENWEEPNSGLINHNHFNLEPGRGYLYANSADVTLNFVGTPYSGDGIVSLDYSTDNPDDRMHGWNLIGNPFSVTATIGKKPFYIMNEERTDLIPADDSNIAPMEGVFVQATEVGETVTFTPSGSKRGERNENNIVINLTGNKGNVIDRAIVSFDEGRTLPKFQIRDNSTKLYIPQNGKDYAITFSYRIGELPLHFVAKETGRYTLSFSGENMTGISLVDMIDNAIIDLSVNDTYSFIGTSTDRADRFKLVFSSSNDSNLDIFAYLSGNDIVVSGEGELQVFDVMGRLVMNQRINGVKTVRKPSQTGVYIFRLNEKVQKIVVR